MRRMRLEDEWKLEEDGEGGFFWAPKLARSNSKVSNERAM